MRPYLAVLRDSFREALASKVLWIALIGIALVLLGLAPFGLRHDQATQLTRRELVDTQALLTALRDARNAQGTPAAHIRSLMNQSQQTRLDELLQEDSNPAAPQRRRGGSSDIQRRTVDALNRLLKQPEFYDPESFRNLDLTEEAQALVGRDDLSPPQTARRNLLLLTAAFPNAIRIVDNNELSLTYGGTQVAGPIDIRPSELAPLIDEALIGVVAVFLGFFGVFASLLVTAGMMPRTFEPGEISLLLSKPVSRSLLFLTKFLGGCCFTLLCAGMLVGGIWALLGLRLDIWKHELLYAIPIYVFLFAIYYSVSAVTGAIYRNAIVSLALVIIFWVGLKTLEIAKAGVEEAAITANRIVEIVPVQDGIIVVNSSRETQLWDDAEQQWDLVFQPTGPSMPAFAQRIAQRLAFSGLRFRPVYDPVQNRIAALAVPPQGGPATLVTGAAADRWEREAEGQVPGQVRDLFLLPDGTIILPGRQAISEFAGQTEQQKQTQKFISGLLGNLIDATSRSAFQQVQPDEMPPLADEYAVAMDPQSGTLVYYSEGMVWRFDRGDDGQYLVGLSRDLQTDDPAVLAVSGQVVTVAMGSGQVQVLNLNSLETITTDQLPDQALPKIAEAAPDGSSHAVLTHDNTLWLVDGRSGQPLTWRPPEDGDTTAVAYDAAGHLLVSDGRIAVRSYDVASGQRVAQYAAREDWIYQIYDYVIQPLYLLLPKPAELDNFVRYVLTDQTSVAVGDGPRRDNSGRRELLEERISFDVWTPLLSNIAFLTIVLGIGCLYVARRDF